MILYWEKIDKLTIFIGVLEWKNSVEKKAMLNIKKSMKDLYK